MMSSQEFQQLEAKPVSEWSADERAAYEADRERQQRITETRRRVEAELRAERRKQEIADLWAWYREEGVEESFEVQRRVQEQREMAATRRQMALEAQITDLEAPVPSDD